MRQCTFPAESSTCLYTVKGYELTEMCSHLKLMVNFLLVTQDYDRTPHVFSFYIGLKESPRTLLKTALNFIRF